MMEIFFCYVFNLDTNRNRSTLKSSTIFYKALLLIKLLYHHLHIFSYLLHHVCENYYQYSCFLSSLLS